LGNRRVRQVQSIHHDLRGCEAHPLANGDVYPLSDPGHEEEVVGGRFEHTRKMISLQHLNENNIILPHVFNIMGHSFGDISSIPRMLHHSSANFIPPLENDSTTHIIISPRIPLRSINPNPRTPTNKKIPLITRSMPMNLSQRPRFHRDNRCTKLTRNRKDRRIDDLHCSAGGFVVVCFLGEVVGVG
jgi:hypothetical protein